MKMDYLHQDVEEETEHVQHEEVKKKPAKKKEVKKNASELSKNTKRVDR
jgi:hypothetical protein